MTMTSGTTAATANEATVTTAAARRYQILVYHHTHWDREWWSPLQIFRIKLVQLIDELLETLDRGPSFRSFMLDGQTIVLEDYLEIRPENRERLLGYIGAGRVECGPWYILPDEFLVSGEAHIRNLWDGALSSPCARPRRASDTSSLGAS